MSKLIWSRMPSPKRIHLLSRQQAAFPLSHIANDRAEENADFGVRRTPIFFWGIVMPDYKLIIRQAAHGSPGPIVVRSDDAASSLSLVHRYHGDSAELWRKDKLLCRLTYAKGGFWIIEGQNVITVTQPAATTKILAETATTSTRTRIRLPTDPSVNAPRNGIPEPRGQARLTGALEIQPRPVPSDQAAATR